MYCWTWSSQSGGANHQSLCEGGGYQRRVPLCKLVSKYLLRKTSDPSGYIYNCTVLKNVNSYPMALAMVASGSVNVKRLITHNFSLENALEAFDVAKTGRGGAIKVMIHC